MTRSGAALDAAVPGGRGVKGSTGWEVRYFTADHLGSTRVVTDIAGTILEQFDYLPYGEKCNNSGLAVANQRKTDYLYGGKEKPQLFGIDWYDSAARWQTTSGIFVSPDPLMEKYYSISPYAYCVGNPVNLVDPEGMDIWDKVAGAVIGTVTNIIPGTGFVRDLYAPSSGADYNEALRKADVVSAVAGVTMITGGGMMTASGASASSAGALAMASVVAAPEGAVAVVGGASVAATGMAIASTGTMMMANALDNQKAGYDRGQIKSDKNSDNVNINREAGLPEVSVPDGYRKLRQTSHGKHIYTNGKDYISRDSDIHNGGTWKRAKTIKDLMKKSTRQGTYDENLKRIGD